MSERMGHPIEEPHRLGEVRVDAEETVRDSRVIGPERSDPDQEVSGDDDRRRERSAKCGMRRSGRVVRRRNMITSWTASTGPLRSPRRVGVLSWRFQSQAEVAGAGTQLFKAS